MSANVSRRTVLAGGAGAVAALTLPGVAAHAAAPSSTSVGFVLDAVTLDGGEQVTAVTLDTARLGPIDPAGLTTGTFSVHAKATSPIPLAPGDQIFSEYDLDRPVTAIRLDRRGNIVLELGYAEGQLGGGTLGYIASKGRNVRLDLVYTITQNAPIKRRHGRHPLIVWLHGGGEGASLPDNYYDNETTLRANRGALGFATPEAQRIFDGAYVVAPQSTSYWMEDGPRFAPLIREIIRDLVRRHDVDTDRIHVVGCSNGGYMSMEMTTIYPALFASSVPICGVVTNLIPDSELATISTPTWLVASLDDDTVPPEPNTIHAHEVIPGARMTLYEHVVWNGHQFPGHWSWIYVARNDPAIHGTHIWQWMARRRRS